MARATATFASVTAGVKLASLAKEAVVAAIFGVSGAMDAYLMGLMLIGLPMAILLNAIQTAFIPQFVELREAQGIRAGGNFLRATASGTLIVMTGVLLVWLGLLPWLIDIVGHGFDPARRELVHTLFLWLLPYYFLSGLNLLGHGALQGQKQFLPSAVAPLCTSLATVVIVLVARKSINALAISVVTGALLESIFLEWQLRKSGLTLWPGRLGERDQLRRLTSAAVVLLGGTFVMAFSAPIEQGLASGLGQGTVAAMGYAHKLPALLNSVLVAAVGVTVLPFFSEMLARGQAARCERAFRRYALVLAAGGSLLAFVLIVLAEPLVALAYQRGAFRAEDTQFVTRILRAYLIQIPGALVRMVAMRLLVARARYRAVAGINALMVFVSGSLAWLFLKRMGAVGIALGLSVGVTVSAVILVVLASRSLTRGLGEREALSSDV
jgi:putative peptidoglycan lipid II flippase